MDTTAHFGGGGGGGEWVYSPGYSMGWNGKIGVIVERA